MAAALQLAPPAPQVKHEVPTFRELRPEEFGLLKGMAYFDFYGLPNPANSRILVGQLQSGEIVAFATAFNTVHVEPVWIHPDWRTKPGVVKKLWGGIERLLRAAGQTLVFSIVGYEDIPRGNLGLATRLGFKRIMGDLYWLQIPPKDRFSK